MFGMPPGVTVGQRYRDGAEQIACEVRGSFKHEGAELRGGRRDPLPRK